MTKKVKKTGISEPEARDIAKKTADALRRIRDTDAKQSSRKGK